jgi:hypothetical protein
MKDCTKDFCSGDVVEATKLMWRHDHKSVLYPGQLAIVTQVFRLNPQHPQIIGLDIPDQMPMIDIVCDENAPVKKVKCKELADIEKKYYELIYAVANKYPNESRHETALRYIKEREEISDISGPKANHA